MRGRIKKISEIKKEDLDAINTIAQRYGIDTKTLGKILMENDKELIRKQIRVSDEEYDLICKKAQQMNLTAPDWCVKAALLGLASVPKNELQKTIFINELQHSAGWGLKGGKTKRLVANFKNNESASALAAFVSEADIPVSSFIRHFAVKFSNTID